MTPFSGLACLRICDVGLIRANISFILKGDEHILVLIFVEFNQILKDVFLRLYLKNDLLKADLIIVSQSSSPLFCTFYVL